MGSSVWMRGVSFGLAVLLPALGWEVDQYLVDTVPAKVIGEKAGRRMIFPKKKRGDGGENESIGEWVSCPPEH